MMQSSPFSSHPKPSSSSSSSSLGSTSLNKRLETVFNKANELCILCDQEVCVIHYGPNGDLNTWPEDRQKVKDLALRYSRLSEAQRRKKSVNLHEFLNKKKNSKNDSKKKAKKMFRKEANLKADFMNPNFDHCTPEERLLVIQSLEQSFSTLQERLRFVEAKKSKLDNQESMPVSLNHQNPPPQTQFSKPNQFSLFLYNHEDTTLSQIPFDASSFNQFPFQFTNYPKNVSGLTGVIESELKNHLMQKDLCGIELSNNVQHSCITNTGDYLPLAVQEDVSNFWLNPLMQQESFEFDPSNNTGNSLLNPLMENELCGFDQSMCISNVQHSCLQNTGESDVWLNPLMQHESCGFDPSNNTGHSLLLMENELCGFDESMWMSDITNSNVQHSCLPNTGESSALEIQEDVWLNTLMQNELCGCDQSMCTSDFSINNISDSCLSNTVSDGFFPNIQDCNDSFSEDSSDMFLNSLINSD